MIVFKNFLSLIHFYLKFPIFIIKYSNFNPIALSNNYLIYKFHDISYLISLYFFNSNLFNHLFKVTFMIFFIHIPLFKDLFVFKSKSKIILFTY